MDDVSVLGRAEVVVLLLASAVFFSLLADDGGLSLRGRFFPPFFFDMAAKPPSSLSDELLSSPKPLRGLPLRTTMVIDCDLLADLSMGFNLAPLAKNSANARIKTQATPHKSCP